MPGSTQCLHVGVYGGRRHRKERREPKRGKSKRGQNCAHGFMDIPMMELLINMSRVTFN